MGTSKQSEKKGLKPPYKTFRGNEVLEKKTAHDRRLYYFDETVDMIVVTSAEKHTEPPHYHTENTEIYYVVRGRLLLSVEGDDLWLDPGDLVVVNPGACHHFETPKEETVFIAIKKEPGLKDKRSC